VQNTLCEQINFLTIELLQKIITRKPEENIVNFISFSGMLCLWSSFCVWYST